MKFFTVLLFAVSFSAFPQQQFNDLKVKNLELINETPSSVVITDDNKKTRTSTVSASELEGLSGVTGNIQEQIDAKVNLEGDETISGVKTFSGKIVSTSTTGGNSPCPPHDQASIDSLVDAEASDCVFNTTTKNLNVFDGTIWKSAGGGLSKWEEGKVFNLDDVVVYDNAIYRCVSAHTSIASFESANWQLISGDTILNDIHAKKIEADKVIQTANNTLKIETDSDNLLVNGGFEAQDVTLGWVKSVDTSIDFIDTGAFPPGKKARTLRFGGTVANYWQTVTKPELVGQRIRVSGYYKLDTTSWTTNIPEICIFIGTTSNTSNCMQVKFTDGQWALYASEFYVTDPTWGVIVKNNTLVDLTNFIVLDKFSAKVYEPVPVEMRADNVQTDTLLNVGNLTPTTNLSLFTSTPSDGSGIYTKGADGITLLRDADVRITYSVVRNGVATGISAYVLVQGASKGGNNFTGNNVSASFSGRVLAGQKITFSGTGSDTSSSQVTITAKARSQVTVFPDETFSTDINPVYWKATACGENEIGCYNTFAYDASNNRTMCGTRPIPQTDADIRINGFRVYTRNHNVASSCATPVAFRVMMPKNLSNPSETLFKDTTRAVVGGLDLWGAQGTASMYGAASKNYNPSTGTYDFDSGEPLTSTVNAALFRFIDRSTQNNGYLVIKASKTGLGMANVPARYPVKVSPPEMMPSWYIVYNDGWVEQGGYAANSSTTAVTLPIAMKDNNYAVSGALKRSDNSGATALYQTNTATTITVYGTTSQPANFTVKGYGAASVVKQYGANPAY